ncbi:MAG TPA: hypothetical protein VE825_17780 [Terriglobales bacterium]|jgi:hypothetical protein|nr:hypothetical protein [Terriglobales bacterium]
MNVALDSMAIEMPEVSRHPNRLAFRGVLTLVDTPSDRPPAGARGHRVLLTRVAAERALPSLLGMGLDYTPALDAHDARRKVGIITSAEINFIAADQRGLTQIKDQEKIRVNQRESAAIEVEGYLFARDFPEIVRELRADGRRLGMSYEVADARIEDPRAPVWRLTEVTFTGAAILRRDKAAYRNTWIELPVPGSQFPVGGGITGNRELGTENFLLGDAMTEELTQQMITNSERLAAAAEALNQALGRLDAQQETLCEKVDRIIATIDESETAARKEPEARIAELERANAELKAQAARPAGDPVARKTLPPLVTALLAKQGVETAGPMDLETLDKTLAALSVEQRIAVKAQMARAGWIE